MAPASHFAARPIELAIVAHGSASLSVSELAVVRERSIGRFAHILRPQLLKHSDEQTLAAAVALDRALGNVQLQEREIDFGPWSVVSATRYLGRSAFATVIDRYKCDGPWGVSVQVIPHTSPHALASTLSMALGSHGPCLGAGAAPGKELQALLTAVTLVKRSQAAGAWLVLSGWAYESAGPSGILDGRCEGVVLALTETGSATVREVRAIGRLVVSPGGLAHDQEQPGDLAVGDLANWLSACQSDRAAAATLSRDGMTVELEFFGVRRAAARPPAPHFQKRPHAETGLGEAGSQSHRLLPP